MKLAELIPTLPEAELVRLGREITGPAGEFVVGTLASTIEDEILAFSYVHRALLRRMPPTFALLDVLIEDESGVVPIALVRERALAETEKLVAMVGDDGLGRGESVGLYARVLVEARRNDMELDASEAAVLGVLRRELKLSNVEHFLAEHHPDGKPIWEGAGAFEREMNALCAAGILFQRTDPVKRWDTLILPEDLRGVVRQALGLRISRAAAARLYEYVGVGELSKCLHALGAKSSGSKAEKLERLLANRVSPSLVLEHVNLADLRDVARKVNSAVSGSKEDVGERLIDHFGRGLDLQKDAAEAPPAKEPRVLDERRFRSLFGLLTGHQLGSILSSEWRLRQSGSKETRVGTLWDAHWCERTMLGMLTGRDLEDILGRCELRTGGAKAERVDRLISHFKSCAVDAQG